MPKRGVRDVLREQIRPGRRVSRASECPRQFPAKQRLARTGNPKSAIETSLKTSRFLS
ncbi:hypothetical protein LY78DRAFT_652788 [Colletotrichum sublineola]|nr:hypothetical protein LY78DRAFT_652788 [Colletotrichum sublineola]